MEMHGVDPLAWLSQTLTRIAQGWLQLRALTNIMPLFHGDGLVAAVLSSLHAGASVSCSPGMQRAARPKGGDVTDMQWQRFEGCIQNVACWDAGARA
ncbi:MAG: hypothetical protein E5X53_28105 [Mesorhizobium sp.]|nr:MAG: hypothetical protein E5X53_28105 [Mesorhizobium sp.]